MTLGEDRHRGGAGRLPGKADAGSRWLSFAVCLFLALAVWTVFGQTLHHEFVNYDDDAYVYGNVEVRKGLTFNGIASAFVHSDISLWTPLTRLSHMLDCQLYGLRPGGHHLSNVLLHVASSMLLFVVLRQMTAALWRSAFVAAVFAIHPLHVESVAWVAERKDVLSGLFFMLTLWAYERHARTRGAGSGQKGEGGIFSFLRSPFYWLALLLFALGLLAKPMLVTLPFVLLLLDYWPLKRFGLQPKPTDGVTPAAPLGRASFSLRILGEKLPLLALAGASVWLALFDPFLWNGPGPGTIIHTPSYLRISNAVVSYGLYIWQMFYPAGLAVRYPFPIHGVPVLQIALSLALLTSISAWAYCSRSSRPYLLVGWLWYLGMLMPVIQVVQFGSEARCDRYTYLPQIGLYIAVAWGVVDLCDGWRWRRVVLGSASAAILTALVVLAHLQTAYWKNSASLWTHTLACTSGNDVAHTNLGDALSRQGNLDAAIPQFERALQLNPDFANAHNGLGDALGRQGRLDAAIPQFERALQLNPDFADAHNNLGSMLARQGNLRAAIPQFERALQLNPNCAAANNNLGSALATQGRLDAAIPQFERALQLNPDYADAHNNLGNVLATQARLDAAILQFERALQLDPDFAAAHNNLGHVLTFQGKWDAAIPHYERALQLKPDYAQAHNNLGHLLTLEGKLDAAIPHCERALQLEPDYAEAHSCVGDALAHQGKLEEAIRHFQQALNLATVQNNLAMAEAIRARLKSVQSALSPTAK